MEMEKVNFDEAMDYSRTLYAVRAAMDAYHAALNRRASNESITKVVAESTGDVQGAMGTMMECFGVLAETDCDHLTDTGIVELVTALRKVADWLDLPTE